MLLIHEHQCGRGRRLALHISSLLLAIGVSIAATSPLSAQTDYYNTDAGRPIRVEDAYPVERRAFELQVAPLRIERTAGRYTWGIEPELAFGFARRTQLEVGFPVAYAEGPAGMRPERLAGVEVSLLHNLNVETSIPAFAVGAESSLPTGSAKAHFSFKGIATKTFSAARFHVNAQYTAGKADSTDVELHSASGQSRWMAGIAVDRTFPLRSTLVTAEVVAIQPMTSDADVLWETGAGIRYQLSPRIAIDGGAALRLNGQQTVSFTLGAAFAFGLPWSKQ